jgi:hypothetical protein
MCNDLFRDGSRNYVAAEWGRDRLGLSQRDYNEKVQVYKRLEQVWSDEGIAAKHPYKEHGWIWDQSNTVLIDDSVLKAASEPDNLVLLPEFKGNVQAEDGSVLKKLIDYLELLKFQKNVSSYIHANPFHVFFRGG